MRRKSSMPKIFRLFCVGLALCMFACMFTACSANKVTKVILDKAEMSIAVDAGFQLTPTIIPEKAKNKTVTWSSDKPDIASVSGTGWVEGKTEGSATITVTTKNGAFTATCCVTVTAATGKTKAQVKSAFETAGYTETYDFGVATAFMPAYTYKKGSDNFTAIFCTNTDIAVTVKPVFDGKAQASGFMCRQDGRILYYGTATSVAIFEAIS